MPPRRALDLEAMQINRLHEWNLSPEQAKSVQKNLRAWVVLEDQFSTIKSFARVKVTSIKGEPMMKASVILRSYPDLKLIEKQSVSLEPKFPNSADLKSFRTSEVVIAALEKLQRNVDLIICEGTGLIDETAFGLASHIGILTHKPTIGLSKPPKELTIASSVEDVRGAWLPVTSPSGELVTGSIVRLAEGLPPVQASPGHAIGLASALKFTLNCFPEESFRKSRESDSGKITQIIKAASA